MWACRNKVPPDGPIKRHIHKMVLPSVHAVRRGYLDEYFNNFMLTRLRPLTPDVQADKVLAGVRGKEGVCVCVLRTNQEGAARKVHKKKKDGGAASASPENVLSL